MSQSLYDALHGMSPEELWTRYHEYPWLDSKGDMVMQGEPKYHKGPMLPKDVKTYTSILDNGMYTPGVGITINKLLTRGEALKTLNHEMQHSRQYAQGTLNDREEPYEDKLSEAQARIVGSMSAQPDSYKDMVNPLNYTKLDRFDARKYDSNQLGKFVGNLDIPMVDKLKAIEQIHIKRLPNKNKGYVAQDMVDARQKFGARILPSLTELLQQGREVYYPPFISQEMQRAR